MGINFIEVNRNNWCQCIELTVTEEQKNFVAPNYESILLSKFEKDCYPMCIYNDNVMVGFLMYDIDPETKRWELSRLMIDKNHQGKGYGRLALLLLLDMIKKVMGSINFYTSIVPTNTSMRNLIEDLGFTKTGEIMWEEEVFFKEL